MHVEGRQQLTTNLTKQSNTPPFCTSKFWIMQTSTRHWSFLQDAMDQFDTLWQKACDFQLQSVMSVSRINSSQFPQCPIHSHRSHHVWRPKDLFITLASAKIPFTFFHLPCDKGTLRVTSKKKKTKKNNEGAAAIVKSRSTCMQMERMSIEGRDNVNTHFAVFVYQITSHSTCPDSFIWSVLHLCIVYINTYSAGIIIYDLNLLLSWNANKAQTEKHANIQGVSCLACIDSRCTVHCLASNSQR